MARVDLLVGGVAAFGGLLSAGRAADWIPAPVTGVAALGAGIALVGVVAVGSMAPSLQLFGPAICRGPTGPRVSLTFDDGPDPRSTEALCDALDARGMRGTFFLLADRAERHPALVRRVARSHEVALHGPSHDPRLTLLSPEEGARRLIVARDRLADLAGTAVRWFRPPFGATSPRLAAAVARTGLVLVWCSVRTRDGVRVSDAALRARCRRIGPGDIALLHEGDRPAPRVLPAIVDDLVARGLQSVTVGELLA
jgi:peptidoglycan/xylan/chitin deacetylase (PgdA/CDA1 family)